MNYIIFDIEATCWKDKSFSKENEIIEIGAIKIDQQGNKVSEFSEFIRPKLNPVLSDFCKDLTSISQLDIDQADPFNIVISRFLDWIETDQFFHLCSWGFYDRKQFKNDCELHNVETAWLSKHLSIKHQYAKIKGLLNPVGMQLALKKEGLSLDGTHHRGIDDARNISKIFIAYINEWKTT